MTHNELLAKVKQIEQFSSYDPFQNAITALRAVVELHKPDKEGFCELACVDKDDDGYSWTVVPYPCPTIQAIMNNLK